MTIEKQRYNYYMERTLAALRRARQLGHSVRADALVKSRANAESMEATFIGGDPLDRRQRLQRAADMLSDALFRRSDDGHDVVCVLTP